MDKNTIFILDDDPAQLTSLSELLVRLKYNVRCWNSSRKFLEDLSFEKNISACLVMDIIMPELDGIEVLSRLKDYGTKIKTILISGHGNIAMAVEAMKIGAFDFIEKPFPEQRLISTINKAFAELNKQNTELSSGSDLLVDQLTQKERAILSLIGKGMSSKLIAEELGIAPHTVDNYRTQIKTKLNIDSLTDMVRAGFVFNVSNSSPDEVKP